MLHFSNFHINFKYPKRDGPYYINFTKSVSHEQPYTLQATSMFFLGLKQSTGKFSRLELSSQKINLLKLATKKMRKRKELYLNYILNVFVTTVQKLFF